MREKRFADKGNGYERGDPADMVATAIYHAGRYVRVWLSMDGGKNVRRLWKFLAASVMASGPAQAADVVWVPKPPATVGCVYDAIPTEMRNLVHDLLERVQAQGIDAFQNDDVQDAVSSQIRAARENCLDRYPLGTGQTQLSEDFAFTSLIGGFVAKWLDANGGNSQDVVRYFQANPARLPLTRAVTENDIAEEKARLPAALPADARDYIARNNLSMRARMPSSPEVAAMVTDLKGHNWKFEDPRVEKIAATFLHMQMQLALDRRRFDEGMQSTRPPSRLRARRR